MSTQTDAPRRALTLEEISAALTPAMLKELATREDLALVPQAVYRASIDTMLMKTVRPAIVSVSLGPSLSVSHSSPAGDFSSRTRVLRTYELASAIVLA